MGMATVFRELPDELCGFYDRASDAVVVDRRLTRDLRVSTEVHESVHRSFAHCPTGSAAEHVAREIATGALTSRMMIPFPLLMQALGSCRTGAEAARLCRVDVSVFTARLMCLTEMEQTIIGVCVRQCLGWALGMGGE